MRFVFSFGEIPGTSCFYGGDAPMQMSQGRVPRWDAERLARTDRAVVKVRQMMQEAHAAELAERRQRGTERRIRRPYAEVSDEKSSSR